MSENCVNNKKKVAKSRFLEDIGPVLDRLAEALAGEYKNYSILAMDNIARSYSVSGSGLSAGVQPLFTNRGFCVRVYDGAGIREYSFNRISEKLIPEILEAIRSIPAAAPDNLPDGIGSLIRPEGEEKCEAFSKAGEYAVHPEELGDSAIIDRLSAIRESVKAADARVLDGVASFSWQEIHKLFISRKKRLGQDLLWCSGAVSVLAKKEQVIKDIYHPFSVQGGAELLDAMAQQPEALVEKVIELLDSKPIVPGEYDCVCTPEVTGMIAHEAFGHGVEMDMFVKDRALAKEYIGKQVASPLVTMHDGGIAANETGSYFFDDEGEPAKDTVVIEKGILKRGISDRLSALSLGTEPTGNGRRQDFAHKVYTRMTNTYFEAGTDTVEDMIASIEYGFLLENPTSGMEDPKNWGIQCMVGSAREIKDGKFTGNIFSPIVLTGYVPDLLKSISMVSGQVELSGSGMCGKGYKEWVKVSDGGPYIKARIRLG